MLPHPQRGMTLLELLVCIIILAVLAAILLPALARPGRERRTPSCMNNLKQFGLVYKMYSNETKGGLFPPIMLEPRYAFDCDAHSARDIREKKDLEKSTVLVALTAPSIDAIYPEYLSDPNVLECIYLNQDFRELTQDADGDTIFDIACKDHTRGIYAADNSYLYFGYYFDKLDASHLSGDTATTQRLLPNEALAGPVPSQFAELFDPLLAMLEKGEVAKAMMFLNGDIPARLATEGNLHTPTIHRLREGMEKWLVTDVNNKAALAKAQSQIAVMADRPSWVGNEYNHFDTPKFLGLKTSPTTGASYVVFLDGHVELIQHKPGAPFPVNEQTATACALIESLNTLPVPNLPK